MNSKPSLIISLSLAALCAGCVGSGPNTEQGAVSGAALGAIAGGIIGNNSRHGDTLGGAAIGAVAGGVAGAAIGNSMDHERGTIYGQPSPYDNRTASVVQAPPAPPPPPPREVVAVRPAREAVWVDGYWSYSGYGNRYDWVPGHWEVPPPRYHTFVQPRWEQRDSGYIYVRGYWR